MKRTLKQFCLYFFPILSLEVLFRVLNSQFSFPVFLARSIAYSFFLAFILFFINQYFKGKIPAFITLFTYLFLALYAFFQTGIKYYYGSFFSIRFLLDGTPDVKGYTIDFLRYIKPSTYLFIILLVIIVITYFRLNDSDKVNFTWLNTLFSLFLIISSYVLYLLLLSIGDPANIFESSINLYKKPYYTENAINQLGMSAFIPRDINFSLFQKEQLMIEDKNEVAVVEVETEEFDQSLEGRIRDDTQWKTIRNQEELSTLKAIDNYFLNKEYSPKNDMTGQFEHYNLVYVLVEAFDMIAIHPELTPTLFKLKSEGLYFDEFYSPQFNCATAESELISLSSLYPVIDTCTMSAYYDKASPQTLFNLFKRKNYRTSSFHNWNDEFYPRSIIHPILGSQQYIDVDQLIPYLISGWQSDLTMMEGVVDYLNQEETPFMSYVITSSTHLPYDEPSELGLRYQDIVKSVYPNAPLEILTYLSKSIELDKAIAYLLENLQDIDNTVLALFADHRPLKMPAEYIDNYSNIDRFFGHELDKTPFIIYAPGKEGKVISTVSSTIDMAPTLANLFNLNYDTRLFMGEDIFSEKNNIVIFQSGSWYDQIGYFNSYEATFTPYHDDITYSDQEIHSINERIKKTMTISSMIYTEDYFNQRPFLQ